MDREDQLRQWDFVSVLPYLPLPPRSNPSAYLSEAHKVLDKKAYEEEVQSQDSTDTSHSDLIPFSESQSARVSMAAESRQQSRRETMMSFGIASNPPSDHKSLRGSDLPSFAYNSADQSDTLTSSSEQDELPAEAVIEPSESPISPPHPAPPTHESTPEAAAVLVESQRVPPQTRSTLSRASFFTNANLEDSSNSSICSQPQDDSASLPRQLPLSKARPTVRVDVPVASDRDPWTKLSKPPADSSTGKKRRKPNECGAVSLFADDNDVYRVAHFIPRCSFTPAHILEEGIIQHMAVNLPNLKIVIVKLVPGQRLSDFVNADGDTTGHILRSQKNKLRVKIHVNEHNFSQGDYFYVPRGNSLSLQNQSERLAVILQLVITKACD